MSVLLAVGLLSAPALAFDHDHKGLAGVLAGAVSDEGVDYEAIKGRSAQLSAYLDQLANAQVGAFSDDQKLAFYVNAYNAHVLNLVVTENPGSMSDIQGGKVWEQRVLPVGREKLTLHQIEDTRVRKLGDARVHAVLHDAARGGPPLLPAPLKGAEVQAQLDEAARRWTRTTAYKLNGSVLQLSQVFRWHGDDFAKLPPGTASEGDKQRAATAFLTQHGADLSAVRTTEWREHDAALDRKP